VFTLGFDPGLERFDDTGVRDFLADTQVDAISDHFFEREGQPFLVLVIRYRLATIGGTDQSALQFQTLATIRRNTLSLLRPTETPL